MSATAVDAAFQHATASLTSDEQYELAQRLLDRHVEQSLIVQASLSNDEIIRRQKEALEKVRGIFEGPPDLSIRHDEYLYGQGKP